MCQSIPVIRTISLIMILAIGIACQAQELLLKAPPPGTKATTTQRPATHRPITDQTADSTAAADSANATAAALLLEILKNLEDEPAGAVVDRHQLLADMATIVQRKLSAGRTSDTPLKLPLAHTYSPTMPTSDQQNSVVSVGKPVIPNRLPSYSAIPDSESNAASDSSRNATANGMSKSSVLPASATQFNDQSVAAASTMESRLRKLEDEVREIKRLLINESFPPMLP